MRVAVVHHWFVTRGGGERVAECIAALFPRAELFTLVASAEGLPKSLRERKLHTSYLQRLAPARTNHRHFLPFYPSATERLDLRGFDLVLSSDSGPIKGVHTDPGAIHICYCHSPMRYLWDGYEQYRSSMGPVTRLAFTATAARVRQWDATAAQRVTHFIANSKYVAARIKRVYGRDAEVIHPPIDLHRAPLHVSKPPGDHYLCAGRLVSYKRTEVMIEACVRLGRKLRIAGTGPEIRKLKKFAAKNPFITFLGEVSTAQLWQELAGCRALLFAADEDFGMIPLEAQACGRPVIAFGAGGSLETVRGMGPDATGAYFPEQTADSAAEAILRWEETGEQAFSPQAAMQWAETFATPVFLNRYRAFVLQHAPNAASATASVDTAMQVLQPGGGGY